MIKVVLQYLYYQATLTEGDKYYMHSNTIMQPSTCM